MRGEKLEKRPISPADWQANRPDLTLPSPLPPGAEREDGRAFVVHPTVCSVILTVLSLSLLALAGCTHLGPKTVAGDRFDYSTAIADSWKQQTLLKIMKLRSGWAHQARAQRRDVLLYPG